MLDLSFWSSTLVSVLLGFLGWIPRAHNLGCVRINAGLIMRTQACSCMHMIMPKNPNFSYFVSDFTCNTYVLDHFSYICGFNILFHILIIRFLFHMFKLGLSCVFLFWCHEHAFTCSCMNVIGVELLQGKWGKSCIHIPMHLWIWFCLDDGDKYVCLVDFFLKYRCNHMFAWIFLCLRATLDVICMIVTC